MIAYQEKTRQPARTAAGATLVERMAETMRDIVGGGIAAPDDETIAEVGGFTLEEVAANKAQARDLARRRWFRQVA